MNKLICYHGDSGRRQAAGGRRGGTANQRLAAGEPKQDPATGGRLIDLIDGQTIIWSYEKKSFWAS
jgi:hypothetical protein